MAIVAVAIFAVGVPLADLALTLGPVAVSSYVDRLKHAWYRDWFNSYGIMLEMSFAKKKGSKSHPGLKPSKQVAITDVHCNHCFYKCPLCLFKSKVSNFQNAVKSSLVCNSRN